MLKPMFENKQSIYVNMVKYTVTVMRHENEQTLQGQKFTNTTLLYQKMLDLRQTQ